ncbi:MAG: sulfite exporter TauE/SafE family protein [Merismopedia sp. SIO2A8]|nr:sulfite exporter TauE/SafE family protein [Symploca sp. SIO2B6]NET54342.1 sulfite exporter TauE/SafE family protein [Merismopedia sp. SIO2A8]
MIIAQLDWTISDFSLQLSLFLASIGTWFISTIAGGGSALLLLPVVGAFLGSAAVPPVTTVGAIFGNGERAIAYRKSIRWDLVVWALPGALTGACIGTLILTKIESAWLTLAIALFLIGSAGSYLVKSSEDEPATFLVKAWYFLPASFLYAILSAIVGSLGPALAPLYINYGLEKEALIATQTTNRTVIHFVKVITYLAFGVLTGQTFLFGVLVGLAAFPGNWLGHIVLQRLSEQQFRQLVTGFVLCSGLMMAWQQRQVLGF